MFHGDVAKALKFNTELIQLDTAIREFRAWDGPKPLQLHWNNQILPCDVLQIMLTYYKVFSATLR